MRRGESNPRDPGDAVGADQQLREIHVTIAVGVHGLPQEYDLAESFRGRVLDLAEHLVRRQAALPPANIGNDAEGAELVAPSHDAHPGADAVRAGGHQVPVGFHAAQPDRQRRLFSRLVDQLRKPAISVRADHEVHLGNALHQLPAQMLRHAARDAQDHAGAEELVAGQLAETSVDALLGVLPDRAGVHEDHVRFLGALHAPVSGAPELAQHQLRVGHVHLTAVGLDVEAAFHGPGMIRDRGLAARLKFGNGSAEPSIEPEPGHTRTGWSVRAREQRNGPGCG